MATSAPATGAVGPPGLQPHPAPQQPPGTHQPSCMGKLRRGNLAQRTRRVQQVLGTSLAAALPYKRCLATSGLFCRGSRAPKPHVGQRPSFAGAGGKKTLRLRHKSDHQAPGFTTASPPLLNSLYGEI